MVKVTVGSLRGALVATLLLLVSSAHAQTPQEWLLRMAEAVEFSNYTGTFLYMTPGNVETFRVYHRVADGKVVERIVALDGAGAEIIRTSRELICIFPSNRSVVVESRVGRSAKGGPLQAGLPFISGDLSAYYELSLGEPERVAGRQTELIIVSPRDGYRYGYRLWVDRESNMPLKSQLIGEESSMPLEEIRFIQIDFPTEVATADVETSLDTRNFTWVRQSERPRASATATMPPELRRWVPTELPGGFMLTSDTVEYTDMSAAPRVHHVY
ncbi:MAG: hypothetical protein KJP03_03410 [Gammaproteobacteria bacterium]|nr:hypothetical protein [Gammaproteobacteria bacterium]